MRIQGVDGEPLMVTCVIPDRLAGTYNSSQLVFNFEKAREETVLDPKFIDRVNSTVAVLRYPAMSLHWDDAHVGCYVMNDSRICGSRQMSISCKCFRVSVVDFEIPRQNTLHTILSGGLVALTVERWTWDRDVMHLTPGRAPLHSIRGQVVHSRVPLSPSKQYDFVLA